MSKENGVHQVIVKSLSTHKSVQHTFDFFSNPKNMESGGAIRSVQKSSNGWYTFDHIVAGRSEMKHIANQEFKILDHVFQGAGLEWNVYVRVLPNGNGSTVTWTFIKPDELSNEQFKEQLKSFDSEIEAWRRALER
jgi:hypothetical protein